LVGVLHAALFLLSWWLLQDAPGTDATNAEIADYYASESSRRFLLVGLYVMPFAGIAFVWFIVALRMWEEGSSHRRSVLQSNLQLISGIVYITLFFVSAAASSVVAMSVEFTDNKQIDPDMPGSSPSSGTRCSSSSLPDGGDVRVHDLRDPAAGGDPAAVVRVERLRRGRSCC
jgi:hypothetical protein